jgi:hypothetical protein
VLLANSAATTNISGPTDKRQEMFGADDGSMVGVVGRAAARPNGASRSTRRPTKESSVPVKHIS